MSDKEEDEVDYESAASHEEEDVAADVDGEKWVLFNNGSESTAWLQVLYGLGFADHLDYNKHDFYFVQYQRLGGRAPKFVLFGVKRKDDEYAQIDSVTEVDVTSTLLQSLQRSEYFMLNLSDEAQICINVLLSAFNMRPNDMNRNTTQLILTLRGKIQTHIKDCFYQKMLSGEAHEMEEGDTYDESLFENADKKVKNHYQSYVGVHLSVDRLCTRMTALVVADKKTAEDIEKSELAEVKGNLTREKGETTRLKTELEGKETENTSLKSTNERLSNENKKIEGLKKTVATLRSEKSEIENAKNDLHMEILKMQLILASRSADDSGKETGGEDAGRGAAGGGERGRTEDAEPVGGAGGKGDTADAEPAGKAGGKGKSGGEGRTGETNSEEEADRRARGTAEGAAGADTAREEAGDTAGDPRNKGNKDPTSVQNPLEDMKKIIKTETAPDQYTGRMQAIAKHLRDYFYQSGEEIQPPTKVKPILAELQTKIQEIAPQDKVQQVFADLAIIPFNKIDDSSAEELGAGLYLLLTRLVTYDNILDDVSKNNIQNIQFKDNETESNGVYIALPHNEKASPDAIKTLRNMYKFCRSYGVFHTLLIKYRLENHSTKIKNYNTGMQALLLEIKNNDEKTARLIDHIFNVGITETNSDDEIKTLFENKFKIQESPEPSSGKIRASRTQYTSTSVPNQLTCANKSKQIYASHARYTPQPAMETASEQAYEGAFPVHFVPVGIPSAHFSSGYMY